MATTLSDVPILDYSQPPLSIFVAVSLLRFLAQSLVDRSAAENARDEAITKMTFLLAHLEERGVTLDFDPVDEDYQLLFTFGPSNAHAEQRVTAHTSDTPAVLDLAIAA